MLLVSQRIDSSRMEQLLPGSLKRKLSADEGLRPVNGVSGSPLIQGGHKRPCLDEVTLAMGPGLQHSPFSSGPGMGSHGSIMEGNRLNNNGLGSPYSMPPKGSPGSMSGGSGVTMIPPFNPNGSSSASSVEQELQDILDELTKNPDPSLSELDIEKILGSKGDEQAGVGGGFTLPEGSGTPKRSPPQPSHLENHLTGSSGFSQASSLSSTQVGPPPPGGPYTLPHTAQAVPSPISASSLPSSSQSHSQTQARSPMLSAALSSRPAPTWHEVSRAQQLQQMASNTKLLSTSHGPPPSQSGQPPPAPQTSPWAGPSPPYRPNEKLPNSSPHQQPFSPAGSTQSPQSSLMSTMVPTPSKGPSPPYHPEKLGSPALAQPPFSPQSTLMPGMPQTGGNSGGIQASQGTILPSTGGIRPSPPYRPDKHSSPVMPQPPHQSAHQSQHQPPPPPHSFSSQSESGNMATQLFKAMNSGQPSSLKLLMQQQQNQQNTQPSVVGQQVLSKTSIGQDPYSFNNTKPLRHFDPVLPTHKMSTLPSPQGSLTHYSAPNLQSTPPATGVTHSQLMQQQEMQQRMPRNMQVPGMAPINRLDPGSGMVHRPQDPTSVPRPTQGNSYNQLLKNQLIRKHLLQEKQRQLEQMNGSQMPECHQVAQFQGCSYPIGAPPGGPVSLASRMGVPQVRSTGGGGFGASSAPRPPLYHPAQSPECGVPLRPAHGVLGMSVPTRHMGTRPGVQGGAFPSPQHLRQSLHVGAALPRMLFNPQQQQQQLHGWQPQPGLSHIDPALQQQQQPTQPSPHFFQQPMRSGIPGSFPAQQPCPPNQVAPGRHVQKNPVGQPLQSPLRPQGPLSALAGMKPIPPSMAHPSQRGLTSPSYPSPANKPSYSGNPTHKLPPYEYSHHPGNGVGAEGPGGGSRGEVDFMDTFVGSNEDWLNNLTMIDEYLEQNSQVDNLR